MKYNFILSSLLLAAISLPAAKAQSSPTSDSLLIDGNYRTFHFNKPQSIDANASLIFVLHGSGGDGIHMAERTGKLEQRSAEDNFLVVYPDGYKNFWNECRKTASSQANIENIDEVAFFDEMINYFEHNYHINARQVFAVGTSGGGHMAYKLALLMPDRFRAITAIIANLPDEPNMDCAAMNVALPVMIINSTTDPSRVTTPPTAILAT